MEHVQVFQLNEMDAVAAESLEQAEAFYLDETGLSHEDAFYDFEPEEVPMDYEVYEDETRTKKQTIGEILKQEWKGEPFIVFSSES